MTKAMICTPKSLPADMLHKAAQIAIAHNPVNRPSGPPQTPQRLGVLTSKFWGAGGVRLTVGFLEPTSAAIRDRILSHMNAWGTVAGANVQFAWTQTSPQVRITRSGDGYWSYLGTDVLSIHPNEPTMCLEGFTTATPESEYKRVVRHETGHTCGAPHEHTRRSIVALLDEAKTIDYFGRTQGWSEQEVRDQILTPLEDAELITPTESDVVSIMTYQFPGACTRSGRPILGGSDIDETDAAYFRRIYPVAVAPPTHPPVQPDGLPETFVALDAGGKELARYDRRTS